ncbi:hypothetical protein [Brevibacillus sp. 1238]|nr:hypothetical protein [Brevibacillus sp. 1238]MDH6351945.1 hypothetical protein [Brevibacillus sp. 1238]
MYAFMLNMWVMKKVTNADLMKLVNRTPQQLTQEEYNMIVETSQK